jgi:chorismate mutase/catechol 2,3-dioxygenase-like lactoylglutathione lyase family enzyme
VTSLPELRARIDETDRELLRVLARRFDLCHDVAALKGESSTQVLQPERVREVLRSRMAWASEIGVEPEFTELLFRSLLSETHRIEAVHLRASESAIEPPVVAPAVDSALQTAACRIDHVTLAVPDLDAATALFVDRLGFRVIQTRTSHPDHPGIDSAVVDAGGVTFVLMETTDERIPTGVHHIAIEVLNAAFVRNALVDQGQALQTDVMTSHNGLERFFTVRDPASGLQLGFVSRVGDRAVFDGGDIAALSAAIEGANATR